MTKIKWDIFSRDPTPDLLLVPDGGHVSQNAVHLLLRHALADVVLDEAVERRPDGPDVVLAQVALLVAALPGSSGGDDHQCVRGAEVEGKMHFSIETRGKLTRSKGARCPEGTALRISF